MIYATPLRANAILTKINYLFCRIDVGLTQQILRARWNDPRLYDSSIQLHLFRQLHDPSSRVQAPKLWLELRRPRVDCAEFQWFGECANTGYGLDWMSFPAGSRERRAADLLESCNFNKRVGQLLWVIRALKQVDLETPISPCVGR